MNDPITFEKSCVIVENMPKIMKASKLALDILFLIDEHYNGLYSIIHIMEYNFITKRKHNKLTNQTKEDNPTLLLQRRAYIKLVKNEQMKLTFPIIKVSKFLPQHELFALLHDYIYITTLLENIFINGESFTAPIMKQMNQINKSMKKVNKQHE